MRNFLTWTFTPLDDLLLAFLCKLLFVKLSVLVRPSLKKLEQSEELLFLRLMGSLTQVATWLEDDEIAALAMCSFDGYDTDNMTFSRHLDDPNRRFLSKFEPDDDWFVLNVSRFDVELDIGKSLRWLFDLFPRWIRNVTFSSSTWLFLTHLPIPSEVFQAFSRVRSCVCVWQKNMWRGNLFENIRLAEYCLKYKLMRILYGFKLQTALCSLNKSLVSFGYINICVSQKMCWRNSTFICS